MLVFELNIQGLEAKILDPRRVNLLKHGELVSRTLILLC
jgi:hypothetical protein